MLASRDLKEAVEQDLVQVTEAKVLPADPEKLVDAIAGAQDEAVQAGCEGITVKSRDARYETNGTRVNSWIKLKNVNL